MAKKYVRNQSTSGESLSEEISIKKWMLILLGITIPIVNIVVMIVLAFWYPDKSLKNYGIVGLVYITIGLILLSIIGRSLV